MIDHRRSLPPGATFEARDGLRTVYWQGGASGSLLFLSGRGDFIEKYAESYWDWRAQGFALASFDWRGQGGSGRLGDGDAGHVDSFDVWLADLAAQVAWFQATLPPPWFVVAHSMGGHLLLRHLAGTRSRFARAVLLAPMLGLRAAPLGPVVTRTVARIAVALGLGKRYAPMQGPYGAVQRSAARGAILTSDAARFADEGWWLDQHPELALGGVSYGWLAAAFASLDVIGAPGFLERIAVPMLVLVPEYERLVDNRATARDVARIPGATLATIAGASHELLREVDPIRTAVLGRIAGCLLG